MGTTKLVIFAKYPEPGQVMTRLCPPLTLEQAAAIQRACVGLLCERAFRTWPVRPVLAITPDDAEAQFRKFAGPIVPIVGQGKGDLGQRLSRAAKAALEEGASEVLIIGSDSPTMPGRMIDDACRRLTKADLVIGPCEDGGFYLIGLKRVEEKMFEGIDWSTDRVASQMKAGAARCGMTVAELDTWYDIDRPADLERAVQDIHAADQRDELALLRLLEEVLAGVEKRPASGLVRAGKKA